MIDTRYLSKRDIGKRVYYQGMDNDPKEWGTIDHIDRTLYPRIYVKFDDSGKTLPSSGTFLNIDNLRSVE